MGVRTIRKKDKMPRELNNKSNLEKISPHKSTYEEAIRTLHKKGSRPRLDHVTLLRALKNRNLRPNIKNPRTPRTTPRTPMKTLKWTSPASRRAEAT